MIRIASKLVIFLAPLLGMLAMVEHKLGAIHTSYETKRMYLERRIDHAKVIVTGSSHSYDGIKPELLGVPSFSVAYPAQDLYYDTRIMLKYLPQARDVDLVVISVSYFSFEYRLEDSTEPWRTSFYYRFLGIPASSRKFKIGDFSLIALYGIQPTREFLWQGSTELNSYHMDETGGNTALIKTDLPAVMDTRVTFPTNPDNIPLNIQYLEELLDALKARRIQAVFVTTPCFRSCYENLNQDMYRRMQDEVQVLCQKYGLKYYNYLEDPRFSVDDFHDNQHLSTRGAEKLSEILKDEVLPSYIN
jgi:DltD protein